MPPTTLDTPLREETLTGWGLRDTSRSAVARPRSAEELAGLLARMHAEGRSVGLRGAGCSYGDAALNDGSFVLDCTGLNTIRSWDAASGIATVEPGVSIAQLWRRTLSDGWWPAVVPGYSAVTIGGAAAANAHGKNNWRLGCFGDTLLAFDLLLPSGETLTCTREQHPALFHAAIGGMGLLGVFTALTLQTRRVYSNRLAEMQTPHVSLAALLAALEAATTWATDLVAWIDTSACGPHLGRGLLKAGRDLAPDEDSEGAAHLASAANERPGALLRLMPSGVVPRVGRLLVTPMGVPLANRAQWLRGQGPLARAPHLESYPAANFTLDAIPNWRDVYRPGGLIQQQSFIPRAQAAAGFRELLTRAQAVGLPPSLAVLKKHRASDFLLSYLCDGYSLALDFPVRRGEESRLLALLHDLNEITIAHAGRCYFAKESTATADQVRRMYPADRLAAFRALKRQCDPTSLLSTNLYRRLLAPEA